jgi:23S rRNA pseudouridine1911/1915/1917 synthase
VVVQKPDKARDGAQAEALDDAPGPGQRPRSSDRAGLLSASVDAALDGMRLDQAAARLFPDFSRARLQAWIRDGHLTLDGAAARPRERVQAGGVLELVPAAVDEVSWEGEALPLVLLHEDEDLIVVDKPAGLVVHPGAGNHSGTLVNALLAHRPDLARLPRAGIVHRLDKDTSGVLVVAASERAHRSLVEQLQDKTMRRDYVAVARGRLVGGGTVDEPIGRHPRQRTRMAVVASGGKPAVTHYRIRERFAHHTALDVSLETGRTHQIRVHLAHRGYPLLGDPVYGGRLQLPRGAREELIAGLRAFRRQALHARQLQLLHPGSGDLCTFASPLAADLERLLACLRSEDAPVSAYRS